MPAEQELEAKLKKLGKERQGKRSIKEQLVNDLIAAENANDEVEIKIVRAKLRHTGASGGVTDTMELANVRSVKASSRKQLLDEKRKLNEDSFKLLNEKKFIERKLEQINDRINEIAEELSQIPEE